MVFCQLPWKTEEKVHHIFCHINNIVPASAGYTDIEHAGHLGAAGGAVQPMVCCVDDDTSNKSEIEDSGVKTEDQSVLAEAPGEKAGLGGGQHVLWTLNKSLDNRPQQILQYYTLYE